MSQDRQELATPEQAAEHPNGEAQLAEQPQPAFGWTAYAEMLNGRFAMIGFVSLLLLELITHQDFFTWLGLSR
ncbi:chlorophyll a/b-binding protein [Sphaerothrix gracilis]|uniref:chlorophyll a/b-binding protein n=1 Tax=Sphaerothrix gracilis TaxID=3151835 RepID=UPI0031FC078B